MVCVFFFKQKTAYEMHSSDCSSDVCSADLDENRPLVRPGRLEVAVGVIIPALLVFIATWAFDFISMFTAATVVVVIAAIYLHIGGPAARAIWFPLAYGLFLVPPPGYAVDVVTMPIKTAISNVATWFLSGMGAPIRSEESRVGKRGGSRV